MASNDDAGVAGEEPAARQQEPKSASAETTTPIGSKTRSAAVALLGFVGGASGAIGLYDVYASRSLSTRITGETLLIASAVMLLGCGGLVFERKRSLWALSAVWVVASGVFFCLWLLLVEGLTDPGGHTWRLQLAFAPLAGALVALGADMLAGHPRAAAVAFVGCVTAAIVGALLAASTLTSGVARPGAAWGGAALTVFGTATARLLWKGAGMTVVHLLRGAPAVFSTVVGAGTVVGFTQFWYQNVYLPDQARPSVNISMKLVREGPYGRRRHIVSVEFRITNPTQKDVTVIGSHFDVVALRRRYTPPIDADAYVRMGDRDRPVGYSLLVRRKRILRSGELTPVGSYLVPGEEITRKFAVLAAAGHRVIAARTQLVLADRRLSPDVLVRELDEPDWESKTRRLRTAIDERSLWRQLTRGDRAVYTIEALHDDPKPGHCLGSEQVNAFVELAPPNGTAFRDCGGPREVAFRAFYRLTTTSSSAELVLERLPARESGDRKHQRTNGRGQR